MHLKHSARFLRALPTAALVASLAPGLAAQTGGAANQQPQRLDTVEVVGSFIPVASDALAIPVTVLGTDEIERTGVVTNALELIRKAVPQFTGNANIGASNANIGSGSTGGGSQASLRNVATLVLINGRRAAVSPISGQGGNQFVDLNIIPLAAIDSIEVLKDGASALYGSDATSGVINIKLKSDFVGGELGAFYEYADNDGNWENRGVTFVAGAANDRTSVTVAGGWSKQDPLFQFERDFSNPSYGTPTFGGVINIGANYFVLNPALSEPPVAATKPTVSFPVATTAVPQAPGNRPYFGVVGSNAVYWGRTNSSGQIIGFGAGELAGATTPEAASVAFNLSNFVTLLQRREARGATVQLEHKLNDNITLFGDLILSNIKTFSQINAQPVGTTPDFNVTGAHPDNPFNTTLRVRNRFVLNPRQYIYDTEFVRGILGAKGSINDRVTFETAVNINQSDLTYRNPGVIDSAALLAAAGISPLATSQAGTQINMFQRAIPSSDVAASGAVGTAFNDFTSRLNAWDGRLVAELFELPAGYLTVAAGAEYRQEKLSGQADLNSIPDAFGNIGWTGATSVNPFKASRDITAWFGEVLLPIFSPKQEVKLAHLLEVRLAGRYEQYSDTDDPFVPKVSVRWLPFNDEFAVRATYGESFNAPTLYQLFGPSDVGFTPSVILSTYNTAGQPIDENGRPVSNVSQAAQVNGQAQLRGGSNPNLQPAESESYTAGVVWSPKFLKGFSVELDYFKIKESDIVGVLSSASILQDVEARGPNSLYVFGSPNYIGGPNRLYDVRVEGFNDAGARITAPGQVANNIDSIYLTRPLVNIASQELDGFDAAIRYKGDTPFIGGTFEIDTKISYYLSYEFDGQELDGRGTTTGGTIPEWVTYTTINWQKAGFSVTLNNTFIPSTYAEVDERAVEHWSTYDLSVGYEFGQDFLPFLAGLRIAAGVYNIGDEMPPLAPFTFTEANADTGTYSPLGRTYLVRASYRF